ncbi:hypothetical protein Cs308_0699 [Candidatus Chlamydia sanziniae]|uniref:Uncharacterized protein n=1 Tax=Candidatus Chlamydia sanziniae TaxID=1806891 RepID=A0A1A9HV49_9CHLA|nr:hypothetical protein Cs308_0699 [Candidatus Chlamydia sanziniae]
MCLSLSSALRFVITRHHGPFEKTEFILKKDYIMIQLIQ